jgi:hypothetical protein
MMHLGSEHIRGHLLIRRITLLHTTAPAVTAEPSSLAATRVAGSEPPWNRSPRRQSSYARIEAPRMEASADPVGLYVVLPWSRSTQNAAMGGGAPSTQPWGAEHAAPSHGGRSTQHATMGGGARSTQPWGRSTQHAAMGGGAPSTQPWEAEHPAPSHWGGAPSTQPRGLACRPDVAHADMPNTMQDHLAHRAHAR